MDTSEPPDAFAATLESLFAAWETKAAALEQQAGLVLRAAKQLRRVAREGIVAGAPAAQTALRDSAARFSDMVTHDSEMPAIDVAAAFEDGSYLKELSSAASAVNVTLVQRDGRLTAFPEELRLEPRVPAVRIGRNLERGIRPSTIAAKLKAARGRPHRFAARSFLDRLLRGYTVLAPDWRAGEGPLIALSVLHDVLTLLPAAAADYPLGSFQMDLLHLDREPDARSTRNHRFELGGSTGTKGAKRLTVFDEDGAAHHYFAIRFATVDDNA